MLAGLLLALTAAGTVFGRALESPVPPGEQEPLAKTAAFNRRIFEMRLHYVGNVWMALSNFSQFGTADANSVAQKDRTALKINYSPSFEFPAGTRNDYLFIGGLWFGGVVGNDTLVSRTVGGSSESGSDEINAFDSVTESSILTTSRYYDPADTLAKAEQQYYCRYSDTLVLGATDQVDNRGHIPLGIEVSQTSYAWSQRLARNFVIIQLWIRNVSDHPISNFVLGVFYDADVWNDQGTTDGAADDISGFLSGAPSLFCPATRDSLNVAWVADNNGDPRGGQFPLNSTHGVIGIRFLNAPPNKGVSFNWWTFTWGPAKIGSGDPVGSPEGDRRTYYLMANQTIDYGQVYAAIDYSAEGWRRPMAAQCGNAAGADTRQMLSCGPLVAPIMPGDSVRFVFAVMAGDNFHRDPNPKEFDCQNPFEFFDKKDFRELSESAQWASWIYDTPGLDSDGDGYDGEYDLCNPETSIVVDPDSGPIIRVTYRDTIPIVGDLGPPPGSGGSFVDYGGLPDLMPPGAPPAPRPGDTMGVGALTFETRPSKIILRWDGRISETTRDGLSRRVLFEGYKLYISRVNLGDRYSLLATWDKDDYRRYVWIEPDSIGEPGKWQTDGAVLTIERLREEAGSGSFDPNAWDSISCTSGGRCYVDSLIDTLGLAHERRSFFMPVGFNRGNVSIENGVEESNLIQRDSVGTWVSLAGDTLEYGFYHAELDSVNPSVGQWVAVTAFDFGNPKANRDPMESDPTKSAVFAVPIYSAGVVQREGLKVAVYPNPYKIEYDAPGGYKTSYYAEGYEGDKVGGTPQNPMDRRIHFINLPDTATISIYTLDGDLVRTIEHRWPRPQGDAVAGILSTYSSKASWDLVTRNTQAAVSGIYIYRIDSKLGSQVGKFVIIK